MYRPEWFGEIARGRSVLQIALDVHMTAEGSYERSDQEQRDDIKCLWEVVDNWKHPSKQFDVIVFKLIMRAITEGESMLEKYSHLWMSPEAVEDIKRWNESQEP